LEGLVWKEISNSTYGKTAQGLKRKRVYDMRDMVTKILPESRITNPCFAAYITSFVRAVLGEVMNSIPRSSMVFSCTTDGFITNATAEQIKAAQSGPLVQLFAEARQELTGDPTTLEIKHKVRQPLGWRTRGQATLKPGLDSSRKTEFNIVLAKGGIFTPRHIEADTDENAYILELFFGREPDQMIEKEGLTGIRDIVEWDADLVEKLISKRLNMEFDWKRRPLALAQDPRRGHVLFSTQPWHSVDQFRTTRQAWEDYNSKGRACIKSASDFEQFATYLEITVGLPKELRRHLRRLDPDIKRLRMMVCSAWKHRKAGFAEFESEYTASEFAAMLTELRIPCRTTDVENALKRVFVEYNCPPTQAVRDALDRLQTRFPSLHTAKFLFLAATDVGVSIRPTTSRCEFVQRCLGEQGDLAKAA
jgi:hypothetical protein